MEKLEKLEIRKMKPKRAKNLHRQRGFSTLQVVAAIAIAGVLTAAAARVLFPMYNRALVNNGYEELYMIVHSIGEVREYNGDYEELDDFEWLVDNGYLPTDRYTDGTGENSFGGNIELESTNDDLDVQLTYVTNSEATCNNLADRMITIAGVLRDADGELEAQCDDSTLTAQIN